MQISGIQMTNCSETTSALEKMTDEAKFEQLATAVLRKAVPKFFGNLTHPGINAEGKTIKSPVDGISYIIGAKPPHMVITHHTICIGNSPILLFYLTISLKIQDFSQDENPWDCGAPARHRRFAN